MIATDDNGGGEFAAAHHFIERQTEPMSLTESHPADPGGETLKLDSLASHIEPVVQVRVVGDQFLDFGIGAIDIFGVSGERSPAEGANTLAEQRTNISGDKAWKIKGVGDTLLEGDLANVVTVVENRDPPGMEFEHGPHMDCHGAASGGDDGLGVALPKAAGLLQRPTSRQVAVERVMGRRLVGHGVGTNSSAYHFGEEFSCVAQDPNRNGSSIATGLLNLLESCVEAGRRVVEVTGIEPFLNSGFIAFNCQHGGAGHGRSERLGAAHAAQTCSQNPLAGEIAAEVSSSHRDKCLVGALDDSLAADVNPRAGGHLTVHHQSQPVEMMEVFPGCPVRDEVAVGDQDARRVGMSAEDADWLSALHQERLIGFEPSQRCDDSVETFPVPRGPPDPAVDDKVFGALGDLRVEIVHQHPEGCFRQPTATAELGAGRGLDDAGRRR